MTLPKNKKYVNFLVFLKSLFVCLHPLDKHVVFVQNPPVFLVGDVEVVAEVIDVGLGHSGDIVLDDDVA